MYLYMKGALLVGNFNPKFVLNAYVYEFSQVILAVSLDFMMGKFYNLHRKSAPIILKGAVFYLPKFKVFTSVFIAFRFVSIRECTYRFIVIIGLL